MGIVNTSHISPGIYTTEVDRTRLTSQGSSKGQFFQSSKGGKGGGSGDTGVDEYLRSIAYTDAECLWLQRENKMTLNFYNMDEDIITAVYLFDTDSDGDIILDAGNLI
jgi:hypothetical protein